MFDKAFILVLEFIVGVKIANHYGGELYGVYSYAMALIAFSPVLLELINTRVVKKYYQNNDEESVVATVTYIKQLIAGFISIFCFILYLLSDKNSELELFLFFLSIDNLFLMSTFGIENYFEYKLESKYTVISNNFVKFLSYTSQYIFILKGYPITVIPIVRAGGSFIRVFVLMYFYSRKRKSIELQKFNYQIARRILNESRFLWFSVISFIIYSQIDSVMIGNILGKKEVGIYQIALQLMKVSSIIILPYANSVFSKLLEEKNKSIFLFERAFVKFSALLTYLYLAIVIIGNITVRKTFHFVFASEYNPAIDAYFFLTFAMFLNAHYALRSSYFTLIEFTKIMLVGTTLGALSNVVFNLVLIPIFGINGAAIATIISPLIAVNVSGILYAEGRRLLKLQFKAFNIFTLREKT